MNTLSFIIIGSPEIVFGVLVATSVILLLLHLYVKLLNGQPLYDNSKDPPEVAKYLNAIKEEKKRKLEERQWQDESERELERQMCEEKMRRMLDHENSGNCR